MTIQERNPTLEEYNTLRQSVGWKNTDQTTTVKALTNALYSVVVVEDSKVIGLGRVIGDGGLYYYVQDLIVHPDFQGRGYGKAMMEKLMSYIRHQAKPGTLVGLMSAPGLEHFYEKYGFTCKPTLGIGMFQEVD